MFKQLAKITVLMVLVATALVFTGCEEEEIAEALGALYGPSGISAASVVFSELRLSIKSRSWKVRWFFIELNSPLGFIS